MFQVTDVKSDILHLVNKTKAIVPDSLEDVALT
jgi:hypothetical protein